MVDIILNMKKYTLVIFSFLNLREGVDSFVRM